MVLTDWQTRDAKSRKASREREELMEKLKKCTLLGVCHVSLPAVYNVYIIPLLHVCVQKQIILHSIYLNDCWNGMELLKVSKIRFKFPGAKAALGYKTLLLLCLLLQLNFQGPTTATDSSRLQESSKTNTKLA